MFKIEEFFEESYYVNFIILVCSYFKSDNIELSLASDEIHVSKRLIEFRLFAEVRDTRECGDKSRDSPIGSLHVKFY